jgi:DNA-binding LacI/PurR family transcriptional regulator/DNA-binding transcriptional regulator YhcF (GntR family)
VVHIWSKRVALDTEETEKEEKTQSILPMLSAASLATISPMPHSDVLFQKLLSDLRRQFNDSFVPGDRLPSKRDLAAMYGSGPTTIHRALLALNKEGLIRAAPRVGWYRAGSETAARRPEQTAGARVAIISRRTREEWNHHIIYTGLMSEAVRRNMSIVEVPNRNRQRFTPSRARIELAKVPWNTFDVALLVEAEDTIVLDAPALSKHKVLAVDQDATAHGIDSVAFDDREVGVLAARYLHELGHIRFAITEEYCSPGFAWDPNWTARRLGFEWALSRFGGTLLPHWRVVVPGRQSPLPAPFDEQTVSRWASSPLKERPTALLALSPAVISPLIDMLGRFGLSVPKDLSIVTVTWGGHQPVAKGMQITCVDLKLENLVARTLDVAAELASEREAGQPRRPRLVLAPALLVPGQSTAPPRE